MFDAFTWSIVVWETVEFCDGIKVILAELKIKNFEVLSDTIEVNRFWNSQNIILKLPAKNDLSNGFTIFFSNAV